MVAGRSATLEDLGSKNGTYVDGGRITRQPAWGLVSNAMLEDRVAILATS